MTKLIAITVVPLKYIMRSWLDIRESKLPIIIIRYFSGIYLFLNIIANDRNNLGDLPIEFIVVLVAIVWCRKTQKNIKPKS